MNLEARAELASQLKQLRRLNCCQSVVSVLADQTDMTEEQLLRLGSGFAGGMGNMEGTCGALVGAVMVAGEHLKGESALSCARKISESFQKRTGAVRCRDLKGKDTGVVLCPCPECIRCAVMAYGSVLPLAEPEK